MKRLEGQVAIVTGGARGIGEGICEVFCREGAIVALWDVLDGSKTAERISKLGGKIFYQKVDVTSKESVDVAISEIINNYGKIEILINNAGIIRDRSFLKMNEEEWDSVMNVNLKSLFVVTKSVIPFMKENGYGELFLHHQLTALQVHLVKLIIVPRKQEFLVLPERYVKKWENMV